jgi:hypothetical protein
MAGPGEEAESLIRKSYEMGDMSRDEPPVIKFPKPKANRHIQFIKTGFLIAAFMVAVYCMLRMLYQTMTGEGDHTCKNSRSKVPQYFDPNPELWPGPTATGRAPFLAQESIVPSLGPAPNKTIERLWGHLSPYSPNYEGWGIDEYPLPEGAEITQVHVRGSFHFEHVILQGLIDF